MKRKMMIIAMVVAIAAIIGSFSLAYFTDTDAIRNEFTVGEVKIDLTEGEAVYNPTTGNIEATGNRLFKGDTAEADSVNDYGKIYPGMIIDKDPMIENLGDEEAYVAVKVIIDDGEGDITKITELFPMAPCINVSALVFGGLCHTGLTYDASIPELGANTHVDENVVVKQVYEGEGKWVAYMFYKKALAPKNGDTIDSVTFFEEIKIPGTWDHAQMQEFKDFSITVEAYATQTNGFDNCVTAITTAFGWDLANA